MATKVRPEFNSSSRQAIFLSAKTKVKSESYRNFFSFCRLAHGVVISSAHLVMFISVQTYFEMAQFFGGHDGLQWFFAVMSVLALVFVYFFLPETHELTLIGIERYFENHTVYSKAGFRNANMQDNLDGHNRKDSINARPTERKYSTRNVEILAALAESGSEYDSLIKNNPEKYPAIKIENGKETGSNNNIGHYDLSKIDYIDKSVLELDRIPYSPVSSEKLSTKS